jgi:hypothetical protein
MWMTTITYDLVAMRAMDEAERTQMITSAVQKKDELRVIDGAGSSIIDYQAPLDPNETLSSGDNTKIVKRLWNLESSAQAFVDHFAAFSGITATIEEQV